MARRGRPPYPGLLTPREQEVLDLLREGCSNEAIAERLGISLAGAKYHVSEILGKLGVESREEAARWQPAARPWWVAASTPIARLWRRASSGPLPAAITAGVALLVAAGIALLVWGLLRTSGGSGGVTAVPSTPVVKTMALAATFLPLPTREPFVAAPINCPGGYVTAEEAIGACLKIRLPDKTYIGDCITSQSPDTFDRPCSTWIDEQGNMRAYEIGNLSVDAFDWLFLEQMTAGWQATMWAGCGIQSEVGRDQDLEARKVDVSLVRSDDCRIPPLPLARPVVHIGPSVTKSTQNDRMRLSVHRGLLYSGRGMKLPVEIQNLSGGVLPWTKDDPASIELIRQEGKVTHASAIGGALARSVAEGMPPSASWSGWLVFPTEQSGTYSLRYPGQPDLSFDLTPVTCLLSCSNPKQ